MLSEDESDQTIIHANPFSTSAYRIMEVINVDLIGPLPPDRYGNTYVLVIREAFSRWTDITAIQNKESTSIASPLLRFFGTFGWPTELRSDGGKEFVNSIIAVILEVGGTNHNITLAYSHEENAIVERANKEVLRRLKELIFETRLISIWADMLPLVQRLINTHKISSIGVSPSQIVFGNAIDLDRHFFPPNLTKLPTKEGQMNSNEVAFREYMDSLLANQAMIIAKAQEHLFDNDQKALSKRQQKGELTEFPIDSIVLAQYHDTGLGAKPPSKLHPKWEGPFRVVNITNSGNTYVLQNFVDGSLTNRHITDLKIFHYDETYEEHVKLTLSEVALRDRIHEFPVEAVLAHRFKRRADGNLGNKSSDLEFHIHWKGFSSRWDSWEPYSNVRLNTIVLDYLRDNKLKRFIPRHLEEDPVMNEDIPIVNRIKSIPDSNSRKRKVQFMVSDEEIFPTHPTSAKRWIFDNRTHKWIDSENIRFMGPY